MNLAIDYDAIRVALVRAVERALVLDAQSVIMAEPEQADAPRPQLPFVTIKNTLPSQKYGRDNQDVVDIGNSQYADITYGPRSFDATFMAYAQSHEQAQGMMVTWQAFCGSTMTQQALRQAGIAIWQIANVADESALMDTGYEGRASLKVTFGIVSYISVESGGIIESASAYGTASGNEVSATATETTDS